MRRGKWNRIGKDGGEAATRRGNYYCNFRASLRSVDDDDHRAVGKEKDEEEDVYL